ncbi:hypothetical protein PHLCEN_2v11274 [Hermanssonia centrifuga]|uniref:NADH:flavin oxidoreductase/NADH oxidase N-terminal domain-containing protein n=1 Tax=Hermanssonia centrifuga TaxID=98765 RepID=A0A2R6NKM5_9APHY|nr:hypothetical protein PHLCEN_2v11274 [Hermanssonia centrifuga]
MSATTSKLFTPIKVGTSLLGHRAVLAPLTRYRANSAHVHGDLAVEHYEQRGSTPGTLLITEATFIAQRASGYAHVPGIWTDDQVAAWKRVTDAVHKKGSYIYIQLWAIGRAADPKVLKEEDPDLPYVSASDVQLTGKPFPPRPLTVAEIKEYVQLFATAASNAVHRAGFDGIELHNANGYLPDQFLQNVTNKRIDEYGGSIENRSRFTLEILEAISKEIGQERTAIRLSPWGRFQEMRMDEANLRSTFSYLVSEITKRFPNFAYLHVVEPRVEGSEDRTVQHGEEIDFLRDIWGSRPFISAGGYTREAAISTADNKGDLIAFGRAFIANPDLPFRLEKDIPLTIGDRSSYYTWESPVGYNDYPFSKEFESGKQASL